MKEIIMPKLSDTMTEGMVVAWRKAVGDRVERGEVIAEVETDKATMELEAFASGILREIRIETGLSVAVGTVIGVIAAADEQPSTTASEVPPPVAAPEPPLSSGPPEVVRVAPQPPAPGEDEVPAAPVVRRRAKELGIDLAAVTGSGPGGRIQLEDLEPAAVPVGAATGNQSAPADAERAAPATSVAAAAPAAGVASATMPLSRMRAAIARTVTESWRTIPHFSVTTEVRMDAAEDYRQRLKAAGEELTLNAMLVKAAALALERYPALNASWHDDQLVMHSEINIGIVVRRDDGLLVPVLHGCAGLPLVDVARRAQQLAERARQGRLSHTELSGGTFAISNLGMYEVYSFVALILPPMAAVLAAGAVRDGVVAQAGQPVVARLLSLTLSADHRVADGVVAAEFLQQVSHNLEHPEQLAG